MRNRNIKRVLSLVLSIMLIMSNIAYADTTKVEPAKYSDIVGNKYESQIREWIANGFIKGYPDGTFKPGNQITRAEFMTLVNRAFGFTDTIVINYSDITRSAWYYNEAAKATKAGFIKGDNGRLLPLSNISRQEIAMILARLTKNEAVAADEAVISSLTDAKSIPDWSKAAVSTGVKKGFFEGLIGNTLNPTEKITRLEAVVTLDRAFKSMYKAAYTLKGEYGPSIGTQTLDGDVVVIAPDVTLRNTIINGNLVLRETIGEGNVYLDNVVVKGETIVKGGGVNSIVVKNSTLGKVTVIKEGNTVRIVASGSTSIGNVNVGANVKLEEYELTGKGFDDVIVLDDIPAGANVVFVGDFDEVQIDSANINVAVQSGTIGSLTLAKEATNTNVNLAQNAKVTTLTLNAAVKVTGTGTIGTANINASGTTIEQKPTTVNVSTGVEATVGGGPATQTPPPAAGGGGGGGGGTPPIKPALAIRNIEITSATTVTFISNVEGATIKWNGVTLAVQTVSGKNTITVPLMISGEHNTLTVEKSGYTAFTNSNIVYTAPYDTIATLGEWVQDRTAPKSWTEDNGWITHTTSSQKAANSWYDWQGRGAVTSVGLTDKWEVETQIELTEELLNGTGVRTSMWVQVDGVNSAPGTQRNVLDWAILQYKNDPINHIKGWESWDSTTGAWLPINDITAENGIYTLTMIYDSGRISQYINGILAREYDIETDKGFGDISAPSYLIIQSRTFGEEYTVRWKVPTVKYVDKYSVDTKFITNITELNDAIANQADNQTWFIKEGIYNIQKDITKLRDNNGQVVTSGGQSGWYMPITANGLTIIGIDDPVITSSTVTPNGTWASQNLITVWGNNVTLKGLTITPKVEENKSIEVVGAKQFTIEDCTFTPNIVTVEADSTYGGCLYFNGRGEEGTQAISIKNNTFNYASVVFDGIVASDITIEGNTFENISGYAIGNTYWGSADRKTTQYTDIEVKDNKFNNINDKTKIIAARLNQTFILDAENKIDSDLIDEDNFGKYINFDNLTYWSECKDNKVIVDGVTYENPYKDVDAYVTNTSQLVSAVENAKDGDKILVDTGTYELSAQLNITKAVSIIGHGTVTLKAVNSSWSNTNGAKHLLAVFAGTKTSPVTISNIVIDADNKSHAVNTYNNANVFLNDVTIINGKGAGLTVNGSMITANNLNTRANAWGSVNVDPGSGVKTASVFILENGNLEEATQIWSDGSYVSADSDVIISAKGYEMYRIGGTAEGLIWSNRELRNVAAITKTVDGTTETYLYSSVQAAIDAAVNGDVINVAAGEYVGQFAINKDITVAGLGNSTIFKAPASMASKFSTSSGNIKPVLYITENASPTIVNLVIDGAGRGNSNYRMVGIAIHNAGGAIEEVEVKGIRNEPFDGIQHGVGIYAYNADGEQRNLTIQSCNIHDYQKNGMALSGVGLEVTVSNNIVTGSGVTDLNCQNGIQVSYGAGGTVENNVIKGHRYIGDNQWYGTASGILLYENEDVILIDNTFGTDAEENDIDINNGTIYPVRDEAGLIGALSNDNVKTIILLNNINLTSAVEVNRPVVIDGNNMCINKGLKITGNNVSINDINIMPSTIPGEGEIAGIYVKGTGVVINNITIDGLSFTTPCRGIIGTNGAEYTVMDSTISNVTTAIYANAIGTGSVSLTATGNTIKECFAGIGGTENTILEFIEENSFANCIEGIGLGEGVSSTEATDEDLVGYLESNNTFANSVENNVADYRSSSSALAEEVHTEEKDNTNIVPKDSTDESATIDANTEEPVITEPVIENKVQGIDE